MSARHDQEADFGQRMIRLALRALPRDFRSAYGDEILDFHHTRRREVRGRPGGRAPGWVPAVWDILKGACFERWRSLDRRIRDRAAGPRRHASRGGGAGPGRGIPGPHRFGPELWLDLLLQDVRFATRSLWRSKGFTVVALVSLTVGIGVSVAFFSLLHETFLKPVPGVPAVDRAVELVTTVRGTMDEVMSYPDFQDLREADTRLDEIAAWRSRPGTLATPAGGEPVQLMYVSASYFDVLGVAPGLGRAFRPEEDGAPGQHPVAVVSHAMWQERMDGDPDVLGSTLTLNRTPYTVVGVVPPDFTGHRLLTEPTEVWLPFAQDPWVLGSDAWTGNRRLRWIRVLARLETGATLEEANASLETVFARLEERFPDTNKGQRVSARAFGPVPAAWRSATLLAVNLLAGLIATVVLIICGNVTGMVLARSVSREREIAVRMALGSDRRRLARLLLVEALLLATAGGMAGMVLGVWTVRLYYGFVPLSVAPTFSVDGAVLAFNLALIGLTTLAVGLLPALRFSRPDLLTSLKEGPGGGERRAGRIHRLSASAQTGVALVLMVTCSLFLRALDTMADRDLGFEPQGLVTTRLDLSQEGYESQQAAEAFMRRVTTNLTAAPGVTAVSVADGIPLDLSGNFSSASRADLPEESGSAVKVEFTRATDGYFQSIGTPLLRGRGIEAGDDETSEPVMVITQSLADRLWPGDSPLGRRVRFRLMEEGSKEFTVVGVVPDVASSRATENWPHVFLALRQTYQPRVMIVLRTSRDLASTARSLQDAILAADPDLNFPVLVASEELVHRSTQGQRMLAVMAGSLGMLALLLSAIGVYGVVAFAVSRRTREIGLRMAMGATRRAVLGSVLWGALRLAAPGLILGGVLSAAMAAAMRTALFGLSPVDPLSFGSAAGILLIVVVTASLVPARQASGIDPMEALRSE